jgi:prevent-host-death family protein
MVWKLAEAKNRLSELVTRAATEGPQTIRRHRDSVVVISEAEYLTLTGEKPSLIDYILQGPRLDDLKIERDKSPMRELKL